MAAGRSSYLDGGIVLYGLDSRSGEVRFRTRVVGEHAGALDRPAEEQRARMSAKISQNSTDYKTFLAPDRSDAFSMRGALTDVLVAEGGSLFMRHLRFDGKLVQQKTKRPHLFSTSSLLDDAEHHRSHWVLGTADFSRTPVAYPWIVIRKLAAPYGLMLAFDGKTVWGVRRVGRGEHTDHYVVFATPRPDPSAEESLLPDFARRSSKRKPPSGAWTLRLPMRPRVMLRAGDTLFIGGEAERPRRKGRPAPRKATFQPGGGPALRMVSCKDGTTLGERRLASAPVWDGMAAVGGRLYVAMSDGTVVCLERGDD